MEQKIIQKQDISLHMPLSWGRGEKEQHATVVTDII